MNLINPLTAIYSRIYVAWELLMMSLPGETHQHEWPQLWSRVRIAPSYTVTQSRISAESSSRNLDHLILEPKGATSCTCKWAFWDSVAINHSEICNPRNHICYLHADYLSATIAIRTLKSSGLRYILDNQVTVSFQPVRTILPWQTWKVSIRIRVVLLIIKLAWMNNAIFQAV